MGSNPPLQWQLLLYKSSTILPIEVECDYSSNHQRKNYQTGCSQNSSLTIHTQLTIKIAEGKTANTEQIEPYKSRWKS